MAQGRSPRRALSTIAILAGVLALAAGAIFALRGQTRVKLGVCLSEEEGRALARVLADASYRPRWLEIELIALPEGDAAASAARGCDLVACQPSLLVGRPGSPLARLPGAYSARRLGELYPASLLPAVSAEGGPLMLPLLCSPYGLYYDKRSPGGSAPPSAFGDLVAAALARGAKPVLSLAGAEGGRAFDLLSQVDAGLAGAAAHGEFLAGTRALPAVSLGAYYSLFRNGIVQRASDSYRDVDALGLLLSGEAAFLYAPTSIHAAIPPETEPRIGFAPFPAFPGETSRCVVARVIAIGWTGGGRTKIGARALLDALARPEAQAAIVRAEGPRFVSAPAAREAGFANEEGRVAALLVSGASRVFDAGMPFLPADRRRALDEALVAASRAPRPEPGADIAEAIARAVAGR